MKSLICGDGEGARAARLKEWQKLKELRCLATGLISDQGSRLTCDQSLTELRQIPKLRRLFLREFPDLNSNRLVVVAFEMASVQQKLLPHLSVRPFRFNTRRVVRAELIALYALILFTLLATQLSTQFSITAIGLTPDFARWHIRLVAMAAMIAVLAMLTVSLVAECSFVSAVGACGLPIFMMAVGACVMRSLMPAILVAITLQAGAFKLGLFDNWLALHLSMFIAESFAIMVLLAGIGMWALTACSLWKSIIGTAAFVIVVIPTVFMPIFRLPITFVRQSISEVSSMMLIPIVGATYVLADIALRLAQSAWHKFEVGRTS